MLTESSETSASPRKGAPIKPAALTVPGHARDYAIGEQDLHRIAADIDRDGYAMLENFLSPDEVKSIQGYITGKVAEAGNQYVGLIGRPAVEDSLLGKISDSPAFQKALHRLYEIEVKKDAPDQGLYQVVRCLRGETGKVHSYYFHYDSYVVTALIPVHIPKEGQTGDLVLSVNRRPLRTSYLLNVIDKVLINNKFGQKILKSLALKDGFGFRRVKMIPGNLYFFWGCRTLHANEPCDVNHTRATALFHFGDLYAGSGMRKYTGKAQYRAAALTPSAAEPQ